MVSKKLLISSFLTFVIISNVCFLSGISSEALIRIITVDALPEFYGGGDCYKCTTETKCLASYDNPCYTYNGQKTTCNSHYETHHEQDGDKVVRNQNTKTVVDDWEQCATRVKCKYSDTFSTCGIDVTNTYPRSAFMVCDTLPM